MLQVESYTAEMSNYLYIVILAVGFIVKQVMNMKKKETVKPYVPVDPFPVSIPEIKQQKTEPYNYNDLEDDWSHAPEPVYEEQPTYSEKQLKKAIESNNGDLYQAISSLKQKGESSEKEEKVNESERFDEFKIKKEEKNTFAELLGDPENFKNAFVLSEILKRRH